MNSKVINGDDYLTDHNRWKNFAISDVKTGKFNKKNCLIITYHCDYKLIIKLNKCSMKRFQSFQKNIANIYARGSDSLWYNKHNFNMLSTCGFMKDSPEVCHSLFINYFFQIKPFRQK